MLGYKVVAGAAPNAYQTAGMTDAQAAALLNSLTTGRTQARTAVSNNEVMRAIDLTAWPTAGSVNEHWLQTCLACGTIDASNPLVRAGFQTVFPNAGATAATLSRLNALGTQTVSRATELGLGAITEGDVILARTKAGSW